MLWHKLQGAGGAFNNRAYGVGAIGGGYSGTSALSHTVSSQDFGPDALNRYILVGVSGRFNSGQITSVTAGGVTLTKQAERYGGNVNPSVACLLYSGDLSGAGSTGDIVVNFNTSRGTVTVGYATVYALADITVDSTNAGANSNTTSRTATVSGDFVVSVVGTVAAKTYTLDADFDGPLYVSSYAAIAYDATGGGAYTTSWSGGTGATMQGGAWNR